MEKAALIADDTVDRLYGDKATSSLEDAGFSVVRHTFPAGERSKNLQTFAGILNFLAERELTRSDTIIALGGGVTGDMAGFAAACYLRGISFVQLPTTLLADVDSSVGGKTAVDLPAGKNLAGAFHQPSAVWIDTDCLATLPAEIYVDGAAECIKYGILTDPELFALFSEGRDREETGRVIARCVKIKADYVCRDEHDNGVRQFLNLGHTVGHAVEKYSDYGIRHGYAVAVGMAVMARYGEREGITEPGTAARVEETLIRAGLPVQTDFSAEELAAAALTDKKRRGGEITLVIPERIGRCCLRTVPVGELVHVIAEGMT